MKKNIFLIEGCNFIDFPTGGQLTFCKQLLYIFPENYFNIVGITCDISDNVGVWQKKIISGKSYNYFPLFFQMKDSKKQLIPGRLKLFCYLRKYRKSIFCNSPKAKILTHAPEALLALPKKNKFKILHFMHGIENPLAMPRYKWAKLISGLFWKKYLNRLSGADYISATADAENILRFKSENDFDNKVFEFQNKFDDNVFKIKTIKKRTIPTFVYCGRLNIVKGWELLIKSFNFYLSNFGKANLLFIGDGEDRGALESYINRKQLNQFVTITGFLDKSQIVNLLNECQVFVLPSYKEGWPISLVEATACALPLVATNVSGASTMIKEGVNGFIVKKRDPVLFANAMHNCLELESPNSYSKMIAQNFKLSNMKSDLLSMFPNFFE